MKRDSKLAQNQSLDNSQQYNVINSSFQEKKWAARLVYSGAVISFRLSFFASKCRNLKTHQNVCFCYTCSCLCLVTYFKLQRRLEELKLVFKSYFCQRHISIVTNFVISNFTVKWTDFPNRYRAAKTRRNNRLYHKNCEKSHKTLLLGH